MSTISMSQVDEEHGQSDSIATAAPPPVLLPSNPSEFALFDKNFDLNQQPPNYFRQRSHLEKLVFQASRESTEKPDPQYSIHLASKFPKLVGSVDVISSSRNVKTLLKMPYAPPGSHVSIMVHRLGNSLLLDEFDLFAFMLRQDFESWEWLRHFAATNNMAVRPSGRNRDDVSSKRLLTKFLYHTASISDKPSVGLTPVSPKPVVPAAPDPNSDDPLKCMVWNFENLRMLLGTNLPIFGGPKHPCVSVRLRDSSKPINVLTGIDYWLDNMINEVPELAMCYHADGLFKGFEIFSTESIPRMAEFDPDAVREIAKSLVWFLKAKATKEGHTYWLFKAPNSDIVKLYDLTSLCQESDSQPQHRAAAAAAAAADADADADATAGTSQQQGERREESESESQASSSPFAAPVGMLCYRVARSCFGHAGGTSGLSDQERARLQRLLACSLQLLDRSKHSLALAGCNLLLAELLLAGAEGTQQSGLNAANLRRSQQRRSRSHSRSLVPKPQQQQQPRNLSRLLLQQQQQQQEGPASSSIDLRQLMASLATPRPPATVTTDDDDGNGDEDSLEPATVDCEGQAGDLLLADEEETDINDVDAPSTLPQRASASLRHALDAVRLLLLNSASVTAAPSASASPISADLAGALAAVVRACLQLELLLEEQAAPSQAVLLAACPLPTLLAVFRVASGAMLLLIERPQNLEVDVDGLDVQVLEKAANAMMLAYQRSAASATASVAPDTTTTTSWTPSLRQEAEQKEDNHHQHQEQPDHGYLCLLVETNRLIDIQLAASMETAANSTTSQAQKKRTNPNVEQLRALRSFLNSFVVVADHDDVGKGIATMKSVLASSDYLAAVVRLYRYLCEASNSSAGVERSSRRLLRERLAGATNEWALRTLVEVKHAMADAAQANLLETKKMERKIENALETLKQVQQQQQLPTDQAVYLLANQALLLRALNECRHTLPRKRQQSSGNTPAVTWSEIKLHDSAMQAYQAALDRLGSRQHQDATVALWDNMAWHRLMTLVDKIEAVSTAPVEGLSEAERCKELIRLERQALAMCDTESSGDRRNSFRYQAAQAHKTLADLIMRAYYEGWSKAKSESDCRAKWMSGYDSCIRLLLSIRGDPQLRNPRMCLEAIGKLAKFQMDRADEARRRQAASGDLLQQQKGSNSGRYSEELALLRILAVARHPLDELAAELGGEDWLSLLSLIRVLSREALDSAKALLQLAKILRDDLQLAEAKNLYSQLLRMLTRIVAASVTSSDPPTPATPELNSAEKAEVVDSARQAFHSLASWCNQQRLANTEAVSAIFGEPIAEAIV